MKRNIHSLLTAIAAAFAAVGMAMPASANEVESYTNCFEVIHYGDIRHVACTVSGLTNIHYAIGKFETNNWEVTWHGGGNDSRFVQAQPGEHKIVDSVFTNRLLTITGTAYPFVFEFYHWYKKGTSGTTWYGYVSLGLDENAELVILESAICNKQNVLTVVGPDPGQGGGQNAQNPVSPETGCETNCLYVVSADNPHIAYRGDSAFDLLIQYYTESCWLISSNHSSGQGYVKVVPTWESVNGIYVGDSVFAQCRGSDGYDSGNMFFLAFKWFPAANDTTRHTRYGWAAIGLQDGYPAVLASEVTETEGAALVGRGFDGVDDGPDDPVAGLIWRCNFNNGVLWQPLTNYHDAAGHVLLSSDDVYAELNNGSTSGRRSVEIATRSGERAWFTVNETADAGTVVHHVPAKWQSLVTSFRLYSLYGDDGYDQYPAVLPQDAEGAFPRLRVFTVTGSRINIDDKLALWCCGDDRDSCWWVNAGVTNGVGVLEAREMTLAAKDRGSELASPIRNWVSVEVEAVNDGSPLGLAYRIYINGVLACAEGNAKATVFRARPAAADKNGITALGIGGEAFIDDVVFRSATIEPLAGVEISPKRFGPANEVLTAEELDTLAGIVGFESLSGLERITMYPWEDDSGCEPLDAPKMCIDLGISSFHSKPDGDDGKGLMLFFKTPSVVKAIGINPAARTVTGQIVPAAGTQIVQPPQRFMFGIGHFMDFGTPYAHVEEYGYDMYYHPGEGFQLDTSSYVPSNGLFTITYDPKFSEDASAFFSLSIKDFRYSY